MTSLGARPQPDGTTTFTVWAPRASSVGVRVVSPFDKTVEMKSGPRGYFTATLDDCPAGSRYFYVLDGGEERADPASRYQPEGVHGPSEVLDAGSFVWTDETWFGRPLTDYVIYEIHTGTFTAAGTFDAVRAHLDELVALGVTALELMPVAQFPGDRNWGYDGVFPCAAQNTYGGPAALARLVDECHSRGLAVVLDVVYNHLGPEGSVFDDFGPYFTERYSTPWGRAINFDQADSDEVRRYFLENALGWFRDFHIDALRLDAVHAILDTSAVPFLEELSVATSELSDRINRRLYLIAESDDNDVRIVTSRELGGYGLDAQWNDDFHHALHALVTGERDGYYADYGTLSHLARAMGTGYVYQGEYSKHRRRRHGRSSRHRGADRFVVFSRNHDQIGNRMLGERPTAHLNFEQQKLVAAVIVLSPYIPLLFMGEEYADPAPFQYFVSHTDPELVEAVRRGRREEFSAFGWQGEPPDPLDPETFRRSKIDRTLASFEPHKTMRDFYAEVLGLRRRRPALAAVSNEDLEIAYDERAGWLTVLRRAGEETSVVAFHFGSGPAEVPLPVIEGELVLDLDSGSESWQGPGSVAPASLDAATHPAVTMHENTVTVWSTQAGGRR